VHLFKNHRSMLDGKLVDTGRRKFGAIIGENVHTGIHTSIYLLISIEIISNDLIIVRSEITFFICIQMSVSTFTKRCLINNYLLLTTILCCAVYITLDSSICRNGIFIEMTGCIQSRNIRPCMNFSIATINRNRRSDAILRATGEASISLIIIIIVISENDTTSMKI